MKCDEIRQLLIPYLYDEISIKDANQVEEHLAKCQTCQQEIDNLVKMKEMCEQWSEQPIDKSFLQNTLLKIKPEILTPEDLAAYLRISLDEVMNNIEDIPHIIIGKLVRFRKQSIKQWLEKVEQWPLEQKIKQGFTWQIPQRKIVKLFN